MMATHPLNSRDEFGVLAVNLNEMIMHLRMRVCGCPRLLKRHCPESITGRPVPWKGRGKRFKRFGKLCQAVRQFTSLGGCAGSPRLELSMSDSVIGIVPENLPKLFRKTLASHLILAKNLTKN
jgi:hypothetical protein